MPEHLRILLVDNLMIRRYGNLRMGPGRKLMTGAIRNNWRICEFSDRDMARLLAPLGIRALGGMIANRKLLLTAKNFRPDVVLIGHCDYIRNSTLGEIRAALPGVRIAHFNVDSPSYAGHTRGQLAERMESCDGLFVTTAGEVLRKWVNGRNFCAYMPNPSDPSMENQDNSRRTEFERDAFIACSPNEKDGRTAFVRSLKARIGDGMKCDWFGLDGRPTIWGADYEHVLATSRMGFSINRVEGDKWYSSDRIAHLMGFGELTFQSARNQMQDFFTQDETVFFEGVDDLAEKALYYKAHDDLRMKVASAGRAKYHRLFSGERVLRYMVETLYGEPYSENYEWASEVYR